MGRILSHMQSHENLCATGIPRWIHGNDNINRIHVTVKFTPSRFTHESKRMQGFHQASESDISLCGYQMRFTFKGNFCI